MATQVQNRRGTTAEHSTFTGANGELTVDTTKRTLVVHDGATVGGRPLLREDQSNLPTSAPTTGIYNASGSLAISTGGSGRLFVDSSGRVGIGTSSPSRALTVLDGKIGINATANGGAEVFNFGIITTGQMEMSLAGSSGFTYRQILDNNYGQLAVRSNLNNSYPAYTFITDALTGIGNAGGTANTLNFITNGNERLRITSAGLVGIGTSSPGFPFQVKSTTDAHVAIWDNGGIPQVLGVNDAGGSAQLRLAGQILSFTGSGGAGSEHMRLDASGRLGIGTTSPGYPLDLVGDFRSNGALANSASNYIYSYGGGINGQVRSGFYLDGSNNVLAFFTAQAERARIDSSGRLLVGTSSGKTVGAGQYSLLNVQGYVGASNGGGDVTLSRGETAANITTGEVLGLISFTDSAGYAFGQFYCEADGTAGTNDYPGRLVFSTTADGASSPTERMRIANTGKNSTYSTSDSLDIRTSLAAGLGSYLIYAAHSATGVGTGGTHSLAIYTNGNIQNTNGSYTTLSDAKLKENIVDAGSQWNDLKAIQIRNWNFKAETGHETHRQIGPIAQELETVCPGLVFEIPDRDADGNETGEVTKGVNQSVLYMKAVKALQEAMERIEVLEQRLTDAGIA